MHLKLLPENIVTESIYKNHSSYYEEDSGLDLFFTEEVVIPPKSTKLINLNIRCEAFSDKNKIIILSICSNLFVYFKNGLCEWLICRYY